LYILFVEIANTVSEHKVENAVGAETEENVQQLVVIDEDATVSMCSVQQTVMGL